MSGGVTAPLRAAHDFGRRLPAVGAACALGAIAAVLALSPVTAFAFEPEAPGKRSERSRPLGDPFGAISFYAGKLTQEVEECYCPEQLVIGFKVFEYIKVGASRTKMPLTASERDPARRERRWGAMAIVSIPF